MSDDDRIVWGTINEQGQAAIDTFARAIHNTITDFPPVVGEDTAQFLARLVELSKREPITYGVPDSSDFGANAAIKGFIARSRFRR